MCGKRDVGSRGVYQPAKKHKVQHAQTNTLHAYLNTNANTNTNQTNTNTNQPGPMPVLQLPTPPLVGQHNVPLLSPALTSISVNPQRDDPPQRSQDMFSQSIKQPELKSVLSPELASTAVEPKRHDSQQPSRNMSSQIIIDDDDEEHYNSYRAARLAQTNNNNNSVISNNNNNNNNNSSSSSSNNINVLSRSSSAFQQKMIELTEPKRSDQRQLESFFNKKVTPLQQPVRMSRRAQYEAHTNLRGLEQYVGPLPTTNPTVRTVSVDAEKLSGHNELAKMSGASGSNQGGLSTNRKVVAQPDPADYTERRPEQMLSHLSEVVHWNLEAAEHAPVEVQFGYGMRKGEQPELFSSANEPASQQWMAQNLSDPMKHLKAAALQNSNPHVKRSAMKLLFHDEQHEARKNKLLADKELADDKRAHLLQELELAKSLRDQFLSGEHTVVKNPGERHAEQNIAAALHRQHRQKPYDQAEISGTMIRCASCGMELGHNVEDEKLHAAMHGKLYSTQVSEPRMNRFLRREDAPDSQETSDSSRARSASPVGRKKDPELKSNTDG